VSEKPLYQPHYGKSWALVIGINAYSKCPPLDYACNDATVFAELLVSKFGFLSEHVTVLKDADATRDNIRSAYLRFVDHPDVGPDDRMVVFFAGQGYTKTGKRGEVGFLVPVDGCTDDISTLVRWQDLTGNAELLLPKHLLFIMDACYGGLAATRHLSPGSMRFLKDMLQRYSRQVLTAGKADQVVADAGGPRPGHSVFTGHLLEALEGGAAVGDGIITANGVMAYVYDRVSKDPRSQQTPHYGLIEGDGDFIFNIPAAGVVNPDPTKDKDILVSVPPAPVDSVGSGRAGHWLSP
jgi:uncharacterized caspase-like protein